MRKLLALLFLPALAWGQQQLLINPDVQKGVIYGDPLYTTLQAADANFTQLFNGGAGPGTVTAVTGVTSNGFTWSIATPTTTPAITLGISPTGVLKGSAGGLAAASASDIFALVGTNVTGDSTLSTGGVMTNTGLNGIALSGLGTGLLKNTTGTGVPSIAVAGTDYATPASLPVGANPTGTAGLSAVNGSAVTFMRSDAAPAISQAISPTMTGNWLFNGSFGGTGVATYLASPPAIGGTTPGLGTFATPLVINSATTGVGGRLQQSNSDTQGAGLNLTVIATAATTTGTGGAATLSAAGGCCSGDGGNGGNGILQSGAGSGTGNGGAANTVGGAGGATGAGGTINITAGAGGSTSGNGGNVNIKAGLVTSGTAGGVVLNGSNGAATTSIATGSTTGQLALGNTGLTTLLIGSPVTINGGSGTDTTNIGTGSTSGLITIGSTNSTTTLGATTLNLSGIASSSAAQTGAVCRGTGGLLTYDTTTTCLLSSIRWKKNVTPLDVGTDEIMKLHPVSYDLKDEFNPAHLGRQIGLIAEDVQKVDTRLVGTGADGKPNGVRYQQMVSLLVKGFQEQQAEITALKKQVAALKH